MSNKAGKKRKRSESIDDTASLTSLPLASIVSTASSTDGDPPFDAKLYKDEEARAKATLVIPGLGDGSIESYIEFQRRTAGDKADEVNAYTDLRWSTDVVPKLEHLDAECVCLKLPIASSLLMGVRVDPKITATFQGRDAPF